MFKVACPQHALLESVQVVSRGVSGRSTQPVQNNVYLEARAGQLRLVATDLEYLSLEALLDAEVAEEGATTVPARLLSEVASALPNEVVTLAADESHGMKINCGRSRYEVRGLSASDFTMLPALSEAVQFEIPQSQLALVLSRTVFSTSRDETRPILTGGLFKLADGKLEVVATDTYRLALQSVPLPGLGDVTRSAIVSRRALTELARILDANSDEPVAVAIGDSQIEFKVGRITLASRLIEGQFVNYAKVIPSSYERRVIANVKELSGALHRVLIMAREDANRVVLKTEGGLLRLSATSQDVGLAEEAIPVTVEGEDAEIAFSARYMLDMLDAAGAAEIVMELSGPLNSGAIKPQGDDGYLYVLMPMQII